MKSGLVANDRITVLGFHQKQFFRWEKGVIFDNLFSELRVDSYVLAPKYARIMLVYSTIAKQQKSRELC